MIEQVSAKMAKKHDPTKKEMGVVIRLALFPFSFYTLLHLLVELRLNKHDRASKFSDKTNDESGKFNDIARLFIKSMRLFALECIK